MNRTWLLFSSSKLSRFDSSNKLEKRDSVVNASLLFRRLWVMLDTNGRKSGVRLFRIQAKESDVVILCLSPQVHRLAALFDSNTPP